MTPLEVSAVASGARAMPKSMSRGPSGASRTLPGFTSRCTSPAAWTASRASASRIPRTRTEVTDSGPKTSTVSESDGPGTYDVASHGVSASASASSSGTTQGLWTCRAACASRRNRALKPGSSAYAARTVLTAAIAPPGARARKTTPMPPAPSRRSSR
ncbi:hypothetical protein ASE41_36380 [Streptomyces sp. Root264]|nr:hypothetical protein ASE41_36380 [Streptomyces sp. Root264]